MCRWPHVVNDCEQLACKANHRCGSVKWSWCYYSGLKDQSNEDQQGHRHWCPCPTKRGWESHWPCINKHGHDRWENPWPCFNKHNQIGWANWLTVSVANGATFSYGQGQRVREREILPLDSDQTSRGWHMSRRDSGEHQTSVYTSSSCQSVRSAV